MHSAQVVPIDKRKIESDNAVNAKRLDEKVARMKKVKKELQNRGMDLMMIDGIEYSKFEELALHVSKAIKINQKLADQCRSTEDL